MCSITAQPASSTDPSPPRRYFDELCVDALTLHITVLPRHDGQRSGTPMMRVAAATGLSIMDLDDVRIRIGEFHLSNKFVRPAEVADMIANNFIRQVCRPSLPAVLQFGIAPQP
jgi:hypothetical protein